MFTLNALPTPSQRRLTQLALWGRLLYFASLATPGADLKTTGAKMLLLAPLYGCSELSSTTLAGKMAGVALLAGFAANLSVFVRAPRGLHIAAILAPWAAFAAFAYLVNPITAGKLLRIAYFFPWAVGIALVNVAQMITSQSKNSGPNACCSAMLPANSRACSGCGSSHAIRLEDGRG